MQKKDVAVSTSNNTSGNAVSNDSDDDDIMNESYEPCTAIYEVINIDSIGMQVFMKKNDCYATTLKRITSDDYDLYI